MDNFIEEQRAVIVQANQETHIVESSLDKKLDGFQREIDQKFDILQESISKLTNQLVHQEEGNLEEECLTDTILGEQAQLQLLEELKEEPVEAPPEELQDAPQLGVVYGPWKKEEEITALLTEEGSGKEEGEEPQKLILHLNPINLDPSATTQPQNSPLPVYILPSPAAQPTPKTPTTKATSIALPVLQKFKKLVATVQAFATTSKTMVAAHTAWHSGWFGCWFGFGAPEPRHL